jgi:hypothetical protein
MTILTPPLRARTAAVWCLGIGAIATLAAILGLMVVGVVPESDNQPLPVFLVFVLIDTSFVLVGALLVTRVPANRVGWLLWLAGCLLALTLVGQVYPAWVIAAGDGPSAPATLLAWTSEVAVNITLFAVLFLVPLLFPTGELQSRRWRPVLGLCLLAMAASTMTEAFQTGPIIRGYPVVNPLGGALPDPLVAVLGIITTGSLLIALPLTILSPFVRYRAGGPVERRQLKWFAAAAWWTLLAYGLAVPAVTPVSEVAWVVATFSLPLLPISIGIAVLRYRLYEIDRIISRTIGWTLVSGILVVVFGGVVIGLQAALAPVMESSTLAIAASTLIVAALFQPLRARTQRAVDRRFNRSRVDADRAVAAFAGQARDEVDLGELGVAVVGTARTAVAPLTAAIWLRGARP